MGTLGQLALSRMRYHKSRSILTVIAILLTTTLLMALGSVGIGILEPVTEEQIALLAHHKDVEALMLQETFVTVVQDKMNASLQFGRTWRGQTQPVI